MRPKTYLDAGSARTRYANLLPVFVKLLMISALVEFIILRGLNRMADLYPWWMKRGGTAIMVFMGNIAYNLAFITSITVVLIIAYVFWNKEKRLSLFLLIWVTVLIGVSVIGSWIELIVLLGSITAILLLFTLVMRKSHRIFFSQGHETLDTEASGKIHRGALLLFFLFILIAYLSALYLHIGNDLANLGLSPPGRTGVYGIGEVFAVASAFLALVAFWRRPRLVDLVLPTIVVGGMLTFAFLRSDILPLVTMWSLGFQFYLFLPIYIGALWCYLLTLFLLVRSKGRRKYLVPGLLLIAISGHMLNDFYLIQMAMVGVLLLTLADDLVEFTLDTKRKLVPMKMVEHGHPTR